VLAQVIEETRRICLAALNEDDLLKVQEEARKYSCEPRDIVSWVASIDEHSTTPGPLLKLKTSLSDGVKDGSFEKFAFLQSALLALDKLSDFPIPARVKKLLCEDFKFYAELDSSDSLFRFGTYHFAALCKTASFRRFPAGQMDWEVSGLPRSTPLRVPPAEIPRFLRVFFGLRGFKPMFAGHLASRRTRRPVLLENALNRTYYQIAAAMRLEPAIKGFYATSWFYSADTFKVSPHLSWLTKPFSENGGAIVKVGPAPLDSGVFAKSPERKKAYEEGTYKPTLGLAVWPRKAMIRWAEEHPEFEVS
jgi:hypothetical protein